MQGSISLRKKVNKGESCTAVQMVTGSRGVGVWLLGSQGQVGGRLGVLGPRSAQVPSDPGCRCLTGTPSSNFTAHSELRQDPARPCGRCWGSGVGTAGPLRL